MSKKPISLSDDEWDDLVAAKTCTIRPTPHTPRLIKLGLLYGGQSRFGNWLKITEAGEALVLSDLTRTVQSMCRDAERQAEAHDQQRRAATQGASRKADLPLRDPVSPPTPKLKNALRAEVAPQRRKVVGKSGPAKPNGQRHETTTTAPERALASAKRPTPNAVRITIGQRITYYPLSAFESIKHGEKHKVFTLNKQRYKPLPVEASAGDVVVP